MGARAEADGGKLEAVEIPAAADVAGLSDALPLFRRRGKELLVVTADAAAVKHKPDEKLAVLFRASGLLSQSLENGDVLELTPDHAEVTGQVQAGMILVDGMAMGDFHELILRDRQHMATDGLVMVVVVRSAQDRRMVGEPEVVFRGLAHAGELDQLTDEAKKLVTATLASEEMQQVTDLGLVKNRVHDVLQKFLRKEAGRRPMVLPVIVEV